jgi:hypothetical protein
MNQPEESKVRAACDELPVEFETAAMRRAAVEWGGLRVSLERLSAGAAQNGLSRSRCSCPHWGFLRTGRLRVQYPDHDELLSAGDLYYAAPGHIVLVEEDCDVIELSPAEAWTRAVSTLPEGRGKCSLQKQEQRAKGSDRAH